jgi:CheY-like chemotaxis protein
MAASPQLAHNVARLSGVTILVVDDDHEIRGLWKHMLSKNIPGLLAADAGDGSEALRLARELQPDLIIMDVAMPGMDGFEATRQLKEDSATSRIPVLVVTGKVYSSHRALDAGCDAYLLKPVSEEQLLREVARVLEGRLR